MTPEEKTSVDNCIQQILDRFHKTPNVFLTEDDVRTHLCSLLLKHFDSNIQTQDGDYSVELHSEVRWYGDGTLKQRSDIVIIDVSTLDVRKSTRMPSKGYGFNIPKGIIEIKFRRPNGRSARVWKDDIARDIHKLERLRPVFYEAGARNQTCFWVVALDKKAQIDPPESTKHVQLFYAHANRSEQGGAGNRRASGG
jgi:hypothetical protein